MKQDKYDVDIDFMISFGEPKEEIILSQGNELFLCQRIFINFVYTAVINRLISVRLFLKVLLVVLNNFDYVGEKYETKDFSSWKSCNGLDCYNRAFL